MPVTHVTLFFTTDPKNATAPSVAVPSTAKNFTTASADAKVLNFALALETLEAELYRQAVLRLTTGGPDMFGSHITGLGVTGPDVTYLATFANVEAEHQKFLQNVLGNNWVVDAKALFDFGFADTNNLGKPALNRLQTVQLVYAAEQTGISAYLGGAGPGGLTPGGKYLSIAASILGTEARHTAAVAILLNGPTFDETPKLATAPLVTPTVKDVGTGGGLGLDMALAPDAILNMGGLVAADTTVAGDGKINPISGPNGFVFVNA